MSKKVPELRFKGFTDDWEERKLGDISYKVKEKNKTGEFTETLTNSAEYGIINQRDFFNKDISNAKNLTGYYVVKNDDFVYNPRISNFAPVGPIKRNKLGRTGVMSPLYYVFRTHDIDKNYLEKYFDTVYWHRFMKLNGDSGVRADRFAIKDSVFVEMPIPYPTIEEQEKIGSFFKQLDDTIALHQRKLDLLKEQKKGFLQKMFPKNGAKVPELRFKGFTDEWEERKLSDIADRFDNLRVPITASDRKPGDTPYYGANGIQDYVEGFTHNGEFILVAEDGANDLKNYPVQYVNGKVWVNNHAHVLQGKKTITDNKFLMNAIKNFNIEPFLVGGGRAKLNADVMMKLNILLPTFVEQEKIGSFFKQLDDTIALHQRKLDLLKEQKKGFLQKMFPKNGAKVPELRFKGFTDDWEERKLGESSDVRDGTHASPKYVSQGHPMVTSKNLTHFGLDMTDVSFLTDKDFNEINKRSKVSIGDILFGMIGTIGNPVIVDRDDFAIKNVALIKEKTSNPITNKWLLQYLKSPSFNRFIQKENAGGTQKFISLGLIRDMKLRVPEFDEQQKIGAFFKQLDDTIALHQRKLDLLKEQKKGFLQKMFV